MQRLGTLARLALLALIPAACQSAPEKESTETGAQLYPGFGGYTRDVTTDSEEAQAWFNQGIQLLYGFNHDEAIRSFQEATLLDPDCAMAWWGIAYASGLHINNPQMSEKQSRLAWEASRQALEVVDGASPVEQALVRAVAERYTWPAPEDRAALDQAYADAMEQAWRDFPEDPDVGALYAEALMDLQPWDLWTPDGQPKGRTEEIVRTLEQAIELRSDHPGANHFYIHTVEASKQPELAVASADRLVDLVPGAGHLVHMPSHIFTRVGRYSDAADANERAIAADEAYFALAPPPDFYSLYYAHNVHFLAYAAMMEGCWEKSLTAARKLEADIPPEFLREWVQFADGVMPTTLHVMVRFGRWEEILQEPDYPEWRLLSRAFRHYARGVALAATDRPEAARAELADFDAVAAEVPEDWVIGVNPAGTVLPLARQMLLGEILYREGKLDEAFAVLGEAAEMEDALTYDEPPGWMQPVRHAWGALLMGAGRAEEAEAVYRDDLANNPENGWSLLGLQRALEAQGKTAQAGEVAARLDEAWPRADVTPNSSCYCEPGA